MQQQASSILYTQSYLSPQEQQRQRVPLINEVNTISENASISKNMHHPPPLTALTSPVKEPDPKNLIVNYIPTCVTDDELRKLFDPFGTLVSARVIVNRTTKHPKGYGFVKYTTEEAAKMAMATMNGYEIENKRLRVMQANGPQNRSLCQYADTPTHASSIGFSYSQPCNLAASPSAVNGLPTFLTTLPGSPMNAEGEIAPTPQFFQSTILGQPCTMLGSGGTIYLPASTNMPTVVLAPANPPSPSQPSQPAYPAYFPGSGSSGLFLVEVDTPTYAAAPNSAVPRAHGAPFSPVPAAAPVLGPVAPSEGFELGGPFLVKPTCAAAAGPGFYHSSTNLGNGLNFVPQQDV
ncbi:unnamed protein product [Phytomonas sp. EM1]|nr:unnamed protein product [Phytomonas sp. EM1]|eukprot:CCW64275.1 unnamed protein product [Phytomonas sp. isolate EM1]